MRKILSFQFAETFTLGLSLSALGLAIFYFTVGNKMNISYMIAVGMPLISYIVLFILFQFNKRKMKERKLIERDLERQKIEYIISNLIPEDKVTFFYELIEQFRLFLRYDNYEIPDDFWIQWHDAAEFESNRERLEEIDETLNAYGSSKEEGLDWEKTCQSLKSNP